VVFMPLHDYNAKSKDTFMVSLLQNNCHKQYINNTTEHRCNIGKCLYGASKTTVEKSQILHKETYDNVNISYTKAHYYSAKRHNLIKTHNKVTRDIHIIRITFHIFLHIIQIGAKSQKKKH